jgi:hypothetical protein
MEKAKNPLNGLCGERFALCDLRVKCLSAIVNCKSNLDPMNVWLDMGVSIEAL